MATVWGTRSGIVVILTYVLPGVPPRNMIRINGKDFAREDTEALTAELRQRDAERLLDLHAAMLLAVPSSKRVEPSELN